MKTACFVFFVLLAKPSGAQVAIELEKMNVLYVGGIYNPLTVVVNDVPPERIALQPSVGQIIRRDSIHFDWHICGADGRTATLILVDTLGMIALDTSLFRLNKISPDCFWPNLGNYSNHGGEVGSERLKAMPGLYLLFTCLDIGAKFDVLFYTIEIRKKDGGQLRFVNSGSKFNAEVQPWINGIAAGDEVRISNWAYHFGCDPEIRHDDRELIYHVR